MEPVIIICVIVVVLFAAIMAIHATENVRLTRCLLSMVK